MEVDKRKEISIDDYCSEEIKKIIEQYCSLPTFDGYEFITASMDDETVYILPIEEKYKPIKVVFEGELLTPEEHLIKWSDILNRIKIGD